MPQLQVEEGDMPEEEALLFDGVLILDEALLLEDTLLDCPAEEPECLVSLFIKNYPRKWMFGSSLCAIICLHAKNAKAKFSV